MRTGILAACVLLALMLGCAHESQTSSSVSRPEASVAVGTAATPALEVPEATFNFGEVSEGNSYEHDFVIRNKGKGVLEIKKVSPG